MHSNWRDCDAWRNEGLTFNTTSNEACKLYDASLTQLVGWYDIEQLDGLNGTVTNMLKADPNFLMGHVMSVGLQITTTPENAKNYSLVELNNLRSKQEPYLTDRERLHVKALNVLAHGDLPASCEYWERILVDYPTDLLALKLATDAYFYLGYQQQLFSSVARVLPLWKVNTPLYSYLYGMLAFGLTQKNFFNEAEKAAKKGLELNRNDGWSTHAICHINEYRNDTDGGIEFLLKTESDWSICNMLAKHNYWHMCLYHIEKGEYETALNIYDEKLLPKTKKFGSYLDLVDACSFLFRLKLDGHNQLEKFKGNCDSRWDYVREACIPYLNDNGFAFNLAHVFMSISSSNDSKSKETFFENLNEYLNENSNNDCDLSDVMFKRKVQNYLKNVKRDVGLKVYKAIESFDNGDYAKVVDILNPIRYDIINFGGSNAQRDIFNQMLTQSALRSPNEYHNRLGIALLNERKCLKPSSKLTERIAARFAVNHHHD